MLNLNFKNNKFYFLLRFRLIFLNFKYLSFIKLNLQEPKGLISLINSLNLTYIKAQAQELSLLLKNNYFNNILKYDYILIYSNDYLPTCSNNKINLNITTLSVSGYFINNIYINKLNFYYSYFNNNFNLFISIIYKYIKLYIFYIFIYLVKLVILFFKLGVKKNIKQIKN